MAADLSDSGDECRSTLSASELRKANKPLMEKRRRARINESLNMLKTLVLDALKRDTSRYSKLEKADILEMTVKHLKNVQRQQMSVAMATDSSVMDKYRKGYQECAGEVTRYLTSIDGLEPNVRNRLMNHLMDCVHKVSNVTAQGSPHPQNAHGHPAHSSALNGYLSSHGYVSQPSQVTQLSTPVQVHIPNSTQLVSLPGNPLEGSGIAQQHHLLPQQNNASPSLLMVPGYLYSTHQNNGNHHQNNGHHHHNLHPFPTPSPNSSRSSSPCSSPPPGQDLNHNDVTGVYLDQNEALRRRTEDAERNAERKQRAFHPYRQTSPKDFPSATSKKFPLHPIINQPKQSDSMWRPW